MSTVKAKTTRAVTKTKTARKPDTKVVEIKSPGQPDPRCKKFDYDKVEQYASTGAAARNVARALGCCETTLYARLKDDVKFKEAYSRGRAKAEVKYAQALNDLAFDLDVDSATRYKAITFSLERVHGWYKTTEVVADVTSNNTNKNVNVDARDLKDMSDTELAATIKQLESGLDADE